MRKINSIPLEETFLVFPIFNAVVNLFNVVVDPPLFFGKS